MAELAKSELITLRYLVSSIEIGRIKNSIKTEVGQLLYLELIATVLLFHIFMLSFLGLSLKTRMVAFLVNSVLSSATAMVFILDQEGDERKILQMIQLEPFVLIIWIGVITML